MATLTFRGVDKVFADGTQALKGLTFDVADGEFVVLVGPSGCGKTTALRLAAGLEKVTDGEVLIDGKVVNTLAPQERDVAMVFQNYALYPHMDVYTNIAFGLRVKNVPKAEIDRRVREISRVLGLEDLLHRKPKMLSGGQRQRVAMGRAIVRQPQVFLMDEPLSNLDARLRSQMRTEIVRIQRGISATTVYVTHDQVEAMTMGDRVCVLNDGVLEQMDAPHRLYEAPLSVFVASFIGNPRINLLNGRLDRAGDGVMCDIGGQALVVPPAVAAKCRKLESYIGKPILVGIRPEHVRMESTRGHREGATLKGTVEFAELLGSEVLIHAELRPVRSREGEASNGRGGRDDWLRALEPPITGSESLFVARVGGDHRVGEGDAIGMTIETERMRFFDPDTGLAVCGAD